MSGPITAEAIVSDIEFELVQGAPGSDSLGEAVEGIQRFQNTRRTRVFASKHPGGQTAEALNTLFQINDMFLGLFRETNAGLQSLQLELRRSYALPPRPADSQADVLASAAVAATTAASPDAFPAPGRNTYAAARKVDDLKRAMQADSLELRLQVNRSGIPLAGRLLTRLRIFLHARGLLYARSLASKQAPINRTYGDWLLYLNGVNQQQQAEIASLRADLSALRAERRADGSG
jgi:hypothetical protein